MCSLPVHKDIVPFKKKLLSVIQYIRFSYNRFFALFNNNSGGVLMRKIDFASRVCTLASLALL